MEQNLTARVKEAVKKLQLVSRQVVPILKLVVLDADCPEDSKTVNIWKPEDELLSMLKECQIFSIYNLIPKYARFLNFNASNTLFSVQE